MFSPIRQYVILAMLLYKRERNQAGSCKNEEYPHKQKGNGTEKSILNISSEEMPEITKTAKDW